MINTHKVILFSVMNALLCLTGCAGMGPTSVTRDRFAYTDAISESWKRQMLLNMVKIRYGDAPVFLDVASVISQYSLETEVNGGVSWNAFLPTDSEAIGVRGRFSDRPTITYQPIRGEKFIRSLMTPIPPTAVLSLIQAGYQADLVFRVCVQSVNGINNSNGGKIEVQPAHPDFYRLTSSLLKTQRSMAVGMRIEEDKSKNNSAVLLFRKHNITSEIDQEINMIKTLLGLSPDNMEFNVVYGAIAENDQEIAILSRSMLEILQELASYFEAPARHVEENRTMATAVDDTDDQVGQPSLMRVQSSRMKPSEAFVAILYRDHWFWIDDRDLRSKRMFTFLMFLLNLAETGSPGQAPLITVPAG
ncbi:MAG: hypothetical protein K9M57_08450 [Phycisphaerae bacterium]|nr:hypothetical protein [Phycisphaerae bacterium]